MCKENTKIHSIDSVELNAIEFVEERQADESAARALCHSISWIILTRLGMSKRRLSSFGRKRLLPPPPPPLRPPSDEPPLRGPFWPSSLCERFISLPCNDTRKLNRTWKDDLSCHISYTFYIIIFKSQKLFYVFWERSFFGIIYLIYVKYIFNASLIFDYSRIYRLGILLI